MSCGLPDLYAVICNFAVATKTAKFGTRAFVTWSSQGDPDSIRLRYQSRGGRWITKYERTKRITNLRIKTMPPSHPMYRVTNSIDIDMYLSREQAEQAAAFYRAACARQDSNLQPVG